MKTKITKIIISLLVTFILIISIVTIIKNNNKIKYIPREPYNKQGFVDFEDLNVENIILENEKYKFDLSTNNTQFIVEDKQTLSKWSSNPEKINDQTPNDTNELFVVYYERKLETPKEVSVLTESINRESYSIKYNDNEVSVLYKIGGKNEITFIDLPRKIDKDKFENKIIKPLEELASGDFELLADIRFLKSQYLFVDSDNTYFLKNISSSKSIEDIYKLIFIKSEYTYDDYLEDSEKHDFPTEEEIPYFEFVVKYSLNNNGLEVNIINDSIYETERYQISYIDILPYFGVGNIDDEGFTVIPDGAGLFIDHNNNKYNTPTYEKRIYGRDLSIGQGMNIKTEEEEVIKLPMYGYAKNNNGFINVVEESEAMSSIRASFKTTTSQGAYTNKIPQTYYRYLIRERDAFHFSSNVSTQRVSVWTNDYNKEDFKSTYIFNDNVESYYDFVSMYKTYIENNYDLPNNNDNANMHITILGGYKIKKNFLGIPYNSVQTLTKAKDIEKIISEINNENLNISYQGWSNDGIRSSTNTKIKYNKNIASRKEIEKLLKQYSDSSNRIYLEYYVNSGFSDKNIKVSKDVSKTIFKMPVEYKKYTLSTGVVDQTTLSRYYLNQQAINKIYNKLLETSNKLNNNNILLVDGVNNLHTDFSKNNVNFRDESIKSFNNNINKLDNKNLIFRNPYFYSLILNDTHIDISYNTTLHRMVDYEIPFYQLIMNGLFSYYSTSINLDTYNSIDWHLLKAIETGSKPQFTLTYNDTVNLINTEYTDIFSTYYKNWILAINDFSNKLNNYDILDSNIVNHKVLNRSGTLIEVEYSNGKVFKINYVDETIEEIGG